MKKLIVILIILCATLCCAKVGEIINVKPADITVKSKVTYTYEAKLADGSIKEITSSSAMSETQIKEQAALEFQAVIDKQKEIEVAVEAMTVKDVIKVPQKTWTINGKVVGIYQRVTLPDGSTQELCSKVPLKPEEWLVKAKVMYKASLGEKL